MLKNKPRKDFFFFFSLLFLHNAKCKMQKTISRSIKKLGASTEMIKLLLTLIMRTIMHI